MDRVGFMGKDRLFGLTGVHSGKDGKRGIGNRYRKFNYCSKREGNMAAGRGSEVKRFI